MLEGFGPWADPAAISDPRLLRDIARQHPRTTLAVLTNPALREDTLTAVASSYTWKAHELTGTVMHAMMSGRPTPDQLIVLQASATRSAAACRELLHHASPLALEHFKTWAHGHSRAQVRNLSPIAHRLLDEPAGWHTTHSDYPAVRSRNSHLTPPDAQLLHDLHTADTPAAVSSLLPRISAHPLSFHTTELAEPLRHLALYLDDQQFLELGRHGGVLGGLATLSDPRCDHAKTWHVIDALTQQQPDTQPAATIEHVARWALGHALHNPAHSPTSYESLATILPSLLANRGHTLRTPAHSPTAFTRQALHELFGSDGPITVTELRQHLGPRLGHTRNLANDHHAFTRLTHTLASPAATGLGVTEISQLRLTGLQLVTEHLWDTATTAPRLTRTRMRQMLITTGLLDTDLAYQALPGLDSDGTETFHVTWPRLLRVLDPGREGFVGQLPVMNCGRGISPWNRYGDWCGPAGTYRATPSPLWAALTRAQQLVELESLLRQHQPPSSQAGRHEDSDISLFSDEPRRSLDSLLTEVLETSAGGADGSTLEGYHQLFGNALGF